MKKPEKIRLRVYVFTVEMMGDYAQKNIYSVHTNWKDALAHYTAVKENRIIDGKGKVHWELHPSRLDKHEWRRIQCYIESFGKRQEERLSIDQFDIYKKGAKA